MSTLRQQEEEKYTMPVNVTTLDAESPPNIVDNSVQYDADEEKKLVRKINMRLIPSTGMAV